MHSPYTKSYGKQVVAYFPTLQVRNSSLIIFDLPDSQPTRKQHDFTSKKAYSGTVTSHSQKRIRQALDILLQISPAGRVYNPITGNQHDFRINFTTLTIAQSKPVTAKEGYELALKEWLRYFKVKAGLKTYLWKAELQQRGQLHYHVAANVFLDWRVVRWRWNSLQRKAGWLDEYARKHGSYNANSTDVHATYAVKNIESYISKYLSKSGEKTEGKVWDCSKDLKRKRFTIDMDEEISENIKEAAEDGTAEVIKMEHCTIIRHNNPQSLLSSKAYRDYQNWK